MQLDLQLDIVSSGYIAMQQSNGLSCYGEQRMTDNSSLITIQEEMKDVDEQVRNHEDMMEDHFESMEAQAKNPSTIEGQFASSSSLARWLGTGRAASTLVTTTPHCQLARGFSRKTRGERRAAAAWATCTACP